MTTREIIARYVLRPVVIIALCYLVPCALAAGFRRAGDINPDWRPRAERDWPALATAKAVRR